MLETHTNKSISQTITTIVFSRLVVCSILIAIGMLLLHNIAAAHYFGGRYADNDQLRYASIESNDSHYNELNPFVTDSMHSDYELDTDNDINTINDGRQSAVPSARVDMYWYAADESHFSRSTILGDATCMKTMSNNKCDQFRVRFNEDTLIGNTASQVGHTVCHEIGHTLGSDDGLTEDEGCWPQSKYSLDTNLTVHEIDHLKDRY